MHLNPKRLIYNRASPARILLWVFISLLLVLCDSHEAKSQEKFITVAVKLLPPCVMEAEGRYTGFDVELWEQIAQDLKLKFNYRLTDQWKIFSDLVEGKADIAFSCVPITRELEETVDFSHHYLASGLRILVLNKSSFNIQYYGFMFPVGSELREPVNRTLLKLKESGIYDGIHDRWFGKVDR